MRVSLFDFDLPERSIAQYPVTPRDWARMMVMDKNSGATLDKHFIDLPDLLKVGDVLVFNKSKVIPARLLFNVKGKEVEIFLVEEVKAGVWKAMVRPGKLFKEGSELNLDDEKIKVNKIDADGLREIDFGKSAEEFSDFLYRKGKLPIPPYIKGAEYKKEDYNTVFAEKEGSVAAPTAGLHFTDELLGRLESKGVILEFVTLEVGLGTFLPMKSDDSKDHKMHMERYSIEHETANRINKYIEEGRRVIAVGTTAVRVLEDNYGRSGKLEAGKYKTDIFIKPGYQWKVVKGLITNFHLPKSTLLMLVSALAGRENVLKAYEQAVHRGYRFYSFGDGMLIT